MKGRIGKNFKAEGRTALEEESNKGHPQWRTQGFVKGGEGDTTGGQGVKPPGRRWCVGRPPVRNPQAGGAKFPGGETPRPPVLLETKGVWGHSPNRQRFFTIFT